MMKNAVSLLITIPLFFTASLAFVHRLIPGTKRALLAQRKTMLFTATTNQPTKSVTNPSQAFGKRKLFSSAVKLILKPPLLHFVTSTFTPNFSIF
jgi:hypothetical protein